MGFVSALLNLIIGTLYGGTAAYIGGQADQIMMRFVDIVYSIPTMLYVLLITMVFGSSLGAVIAAIAISSWASMARIVRSQVLTLKEQEFTLAAQALGASGKRILVKYLLLNSVGPIIVTATLNVPTAVFFGSLPELCGLRRCHSHGQLGHALQ